MSLLFAATYPERVRALVCYGGTARATYADDYPWAVQAEALVESTVELLAPHWGGDGSPKGRAFEIADYVRSRIGAAAEPQAQVSQPAPQAPAPAEDVYEQLRKLGELRDAGVLTDAEFNEKKAALLARL